jgi:hypothetical protein
MEYKYKVELAALPDCPPSSYSPGRREAYRFVFGQNWRRSFLPPSRHSPRRGFRTDREKCSGWALSFFSTAAQARTRFEQLIKNAPRILITVGDSLAVGQLEEIDGVMCSPNGIGHLELHEYKGNRLAYRFTLAGPLP